MATITAHSRCQADTYSIDDVKAQVWERLLGENLHLWNTLPPPNANNEVDRHVQAFLDKYTPLTNDSAPHIEVKAIWDEGRQGDEAAEGGNTGLSETLCRRKDVLQAKLYINRDEGREELTRWASLAPKERMVFWLGRMKCRKMLADYSNTAWDPIRQSIDDKAAAEAKRMYHLIREALGLESITEIDEKSEDPELVRYRESLANFKERYLTEMEEKMLDELTYFGRGQVPVAGGESDGDFGVASVVELQYTPLNSTFTPAGRNAVVQKAGPSPPNKTPILSSILARWYCYIDPDIPMLRLGISLVKLSVIIYHAASSLQ
ncbi:hypothetical protein BJ508DRAFT_313063 [Ascobolus immersus RN42]|uniref:Uncharacterized protein n=1 Tax=Ascobolus immersus RN42 TaxID=1160509 RepID=A0A3N4HK90_ASCIM|nr:hypothetical protein BJ508DRAFT_313063 [Ascobolus immersus RN42]